MASTTRKQMEKYASLDTNCGFNSRSFIHTAKNGIGVTILVGRALFSQWKQCEKNNTNENIGEICAEYKLQQKIRYEASADADCEQNMNRKAWNIIESFIY